MNFDLAAGHQASPTGFWWFLGGCAAIVAVGMLAMFWRPRMAWPPLIAFRFLEKFRIDRKTQTE